MDKLIIYNLLFLYLSLHPVMQPMKLFDRWYKDPVLSEYERPEYDDLRNILSELRKEIDR